jgi:hypothetical protein
MAQKVSALLGFLPTSTSKLLGKSDGTPGYAVAKS